MVFELFGLGGEREERVNKNNDTIGDNSLGRS